jgi:sulfonate transport system ATP-binding protein
LTEPATDSFPVVAASVAVRTKAFPLNGRSRLVFSNLLFNVRECEFLAILGPSGCGKTTLLRLLAGLDLDYEGSVIVNGRPVLSPNRERSLLFQESRLLPWLRVAQNVAFALPPNTPRDLRHERVSSALRLVGLSDYAKAWPYQLSGGMAKRAALARAIINSPYLLLLDEPFSALDSPTKHSLQDEIARLRAMDDRMTTILVTHDIDEAVYLSDRILILSPISSNILTEISVSLQRPRDRATRVFQDVCSRVTQKVFEIGWKTLPDNGISTSVDS